MLLSLVTGWLVVLAAPVGAQSPDPGEAGPAAGETGPDAGEAVERAAPSDVEVLEFAGTEPVGDTDPAGDADDGAETDRELVLGLVAVVLLAVAIGLHALHRDPE